jgi:hypothetical protein
MRKLLSSCIVGALLMLSGCGPKSETGALPTETVAKPPRADLMEVPEELKKPVATVVSQGYIDIVDEIGAAVSGDKERIFHAKSDAPLWLRGWAYDETAKSIPNRVVIELTNKKSGARFFLPATRQERQDVATGFKVPWARMSGFSTPTITDHNIPRGAYDAKVYQIDGNAVELTRYYSVGAVTLIFE